MEITFSDKLHLLQNAELNELINRTVGLINPDRIYLTHYEHHQTCFDELIIVIPNSSTLHILEARALINTIMVRFPAFRFRMFYIDEIKICMKHGSILLFEICRPENLIYQNTKSNSILIHPDLEAEAVLDKTSRNFQKELEKIASFREGADFYISEKNYVFSAFMLHQAIELSYRAAEIIAIGKEKISHNIRGHQKFLTPYLPELSIVFIESDEAEMKLVDLLDDAYRSVRYENSYQISLEQLNLFITKADLINKLVIEVYETVVKQFERKCLTTWTSPKIIKEVHGVSTQLEDSREKLPNGNKLLGLIESITASISVSYIYHLGHSTKSATYDGLYKEGMKDNTNEHFDLLIITEQPIDTGTINLQSKINQQNEANGSVTLLIHSLKDVQKDLWDNNRFFNEILRSEKPIYIKSKILETHGLPDYDPDKELSSSKLHWYKRQQRAEALIIAAVNITENETELVEVWLLNQAMEQICLGFIYVITGYRPNQQTLAHLFSICRCINPIIDEVFPTGTEDDKEIFNTLVSSKRDLRYYVGTNIDPTDLGLLHRRCRAWASTAEELVNTMLNHRQRLKIAELNQLD